MDLLIILFLQFKVLLQRMNIEMGKESLKEAVASKRHNCTQILVLKDNDSVFSHHLLSNSYSKPHAYFYPKMKPGAAVTSN